MLVAFGLLFATMKLAAGLVGAVGFVLAVLEAVLSLLRRSN